MYKNQIIQKYNDNIYCIVETNKINQYLIIGEERALLFDTGFGYTSVEAVVRTITDKPLFVVNSHADIDHAGGNFRFKEVYLSKYDLRFLSELDDKEARQKTLAYRSTKPGANTIADMAEEGMTPEKFMEWSIFDPVYHLIDEGDHFDLGGIDLEVISIPGHTVGCIGLLDRKHGYFFSGDSVMEHVIYFIPGEKRAPLAVYQNSLQKLKNMESDLKYIFPGHLSLPLHIDVIDALLECLKGIKNDSIQSTWDAHEKAHLYTYQNVSILCDDYSIQEYKKFK